MIPGGRLGLLAHDLSGPLTVICGYAELLRLRDDDETRLEAADRIEEAAERLSAMITELVSSTTEAELSERLTARPTSL